MLMMLTEYIALYTSQPDLVASLTILALLLIAATISIFRRDSLVAALLIASLIAAGTWWIGYPSPICTNGRIIGADIRAGQGIYLYIETPTAPHSCALPYDNQTAQRLQDALEAQGEGDGTLSYNFNFNYGLYPEEGHEFHLEIPGPQIPDKPDVTPPRQEGQVT